MSNSYNFDFLRSQHIENEKSEETAASSSATPPAPAAPTNIDWEAVAAKPDLEKQFDILAFLQAHRSSGFLAPSLIYQRTGIDLSVNPNVSELLQANPKIHVEMVPDPENPNFGLPTYAYRPQYANVHNKATLLAQVNKMMGISCRDLMDSYMTIEDDIEALIQAGDVICMANTEDKDKILFPRGVSFLVELDGVVSLPTKGRAAQSSSAYGYRPDATNNTLPPIHSVQTDVDPRRQIRRGEAIQIGGQWFRVSSAVGSSSTKKDQPARAQAPLSVVSLADLSSRNSMDGYVHEFSAQAIPVDDDMGPTARHNIQQATTARRDLLQFTHPSNSSRSAQLLLGSNAHSSNPTTLAASMGQQPSHARKKPRTTTISPEQEACFKNPHLSLYAHARRHGCTLDVRDLYLSTRSLVPESDHNLQTKLIQEHLLDAAEPLRATKLQTMQNVKKKPKKRRYYERKNQRMTNTHLEGTVIGAILARAAEQQAQGKAVGDGGM